MLYVSPGWRHVLPLQSARGGPFLHWTLSQPCCRVLLGIWHLWRGLPPLTHRLIAIRCMHVMSWRHTVVYNSCYCDFSMWHALVMVLARWSAGAASWRSHWVDWKRYPPSPPPHRPDPMFSPARCSYWCTRRPWPGPVGWGGPVSTSTSDIVFFPASTRVCVWTTRAGSRYGLACSYMSNEESAHVNCGPHRLPQRSSREI